MHDQLTVCFFPVVDFQSGRKFPGTKLFFGREILKGDQLKYPYYVSLGKTCCNGYRMLLLMQYLPNSFSYLMLRYAAVF